MAFIDFESQCEIGTAQNSIVGTPGYQAPEVLDGSYFPYSPEKTDIYSIGITLKVILENFIKRFKMKYDNLEHALDLIKIMTNKYKPS